MNTILKTLLLFTQPLFLTWLLLGICLLRLLWNRNNLHRWMPVVAWLLLTAFSCTPIAAVLLADLENRVPRVQLNALPEADAILCLGGGVEPSLSEPTGFHLKVGADRLSTALMLASAKKAPLLILGGGGYPQEGRTFSEADAIRDYLTANVTLTIQLHSIGVCSDTHDEVLKAAEVMKKRGLKRLLLVTSASHMPRAIAVFSKTDVLVTPVPCNYLSSLNTVGDFRWLHWPSYHGFELFTMWAHEIIGHYVYLWRGWI